MITILAMTIITTVLFLIIIAILLFKIRDLIKKNKYADEANMWHKLAVTDDLTGIYNRNAYNLHINKIKKSTEKISRGIIVFDVDNFKTINDTKGHPAGDNVLRDVSKILLEVFPRPHYRVFRMGGDEFSVLSEGVCEEEIIERLIDLKNKLKCNADMNLSKGYSMISENPDLAFKHADEMLYADKLAKNLRS